MKNLSMAVVVKDGKVLIQQRFRTNQGMVFEFPGGAVDDGESGEQAATRELWEEVGLRELTAVASHQAENEYGGVIHYIVFSAPSAARPQAIDPERQQTFHWLNPQDIPLQDFFSADVAFIQHHLSGLIRQFIK
ncbi:NUDIX hydrolase [Vibrio sp. T187]|uniref:NUDIX hydrolase n=1 Tax=Vibrio TaxID=662 RepID=UPI0010C999E3|nr:MULTISPECIES: NUDIX hydrolase [Vibrio]MBW3695317.1 NUDIX hydrolase [Vibrio sp. T187]